jgi:hypothetical protein
MPYTSEDFIEEYPSIDRAWALCFLAEHGASLGDYEADNGPLGAEVDTATLMHWLGY